MDRTLPLPATALAEPATSWATSYRVRFDEAGPDGVLRTSGFMRYAQDLAFVEGETDVLQPFHDRCIGVGDLAQLKNTAAGFAK